MFHVYIDKQFFFKKSFSFNENLITIYLLAIKIQWLPHLLRMYTTLLPFHEFSLALCRNNIFHFLKVNHCYCLCRDKLVIFL